MSRNWARILGGVTAMGAVWVAGYWWLNPRPSGKISFGAEPGGVGKAPPPRPRAPVEVVDLKRDPLIARTPAPAERPGPAVPAPATKPTQITPVSGSAPKPPASAPAVIPPKFTEYTVKPNDTLIGIATMEMGAARHADAIRRANPLKDLDRIKAGDIIRIPQDPTNIQGRPASGSPSPTPPPDRQGEMIEYTIKSGDTLSKIAKEKYGSTAYKDLIYQANRDRLSSPNALREGQKLRLPPKPAN